MIEAREISKRFGPHLALDKASFRIKPGEVVGFLGPNGAGKTTTLRILTGYLRPTSGHVCIAGFDIQSHPIEARRHFGYLPETPPLYDELTVEEMLRFVARVRGMTEIDTPLGEAIEKTRLGEVRHRAIGRLSKGYRQRVGIAQAILHNPPIIILDEPTNGLDPVQIQEIRGLISDLARGRGNASILLSSHLLQEVNHLCDRVLIMNRGRIVADLKMKELSNYSGHRRLIVSVRAGESQRVKDEISKIRDVESISDFASDLEEVFLKLTESGQ